MKKYLLTIIFIGLMAHLSWACSCEGPVLTFCELLDKESELLAVQVEAITAPTDSTYASMTVTILEIINGTAFDSLTKLTVFGSQLYNGQKIFHSGTESRFSHL